MMFLRAVPFLAAVLLAGCSLGPTQDMATGPLVTLPGPNTQQATIAPAALPTATTPTQQQMADVSAFVDANALKLMSGNDRGQAASAQHNALMFGRPGAPRSWNGDRGATGQVTVGPFVQSNSLVCRNFTHTVTIAGSSYTRNGTACREGDNSWSITG